MSMMMKANHSIKIKKINLKICCDDDNLLQNFGAFLSTNDSSNLSNSDISFEIFSSTTKQIYHLSRYTTPECITDDNFILICLFNENISQCSIKAITTILRPLLDNFKENCCILRYTDPNIAISQNQNVVQNSIKEAETLASSLQVQFINIDSQFREDVIRQISRNFPTFFK